MGDEDAAKLNAIQSMDLAGDTGFILAPGCDLPFDVKLENLEAVAQMVHDDYQRDVARATQAAPMDTFDDIVLPDYESESAVYIDVVTLDSEGCAPCQYMWRAALDAAEELEGDVATVVREHKITSREGVGMLVKLGVPNLPSICIDGECKFASLIPRRSELVAEIVEAAEVKEEVPA